MAYVNELQLVPTYQIVGTIDLPYLSYGNNRADYSGNVFELFHESVCSKLEDVPKIIPNKTAFYIRYRKTKNGKNFNTHTILALVDVVSEYMVDRTTESCKLSFTFVEVPINSYDPTITRIDPVISHIFADHEYIAVVLEGDVDYASQYANSNFRSFVHADKVYWMIDTLQYNVHLRPGEPSIDVERPAVAIVVVASTLKVVNNRNYQEFTAMLERYLNNIYGQNKGG